MSEYWQTTTRTRDVGLSNSTARPIKDKVFLYVGETGAICIQGQVVTRFTKTYHRYEDTFDSSWLEVQ